MVTKNPFHSKIQSQMEMFSLLHFFVKMFLCSCYMIALPLRYFITVKNCALILLNLSFYIWMYI